MTLADVRFCDLVPKDLLHSMIRAVRRRTGIPGILSSAQELNVCDDFKILSALVVVWLNSLSPREKRIVQDRILKEPQSAPKPRKLRDATLS